MQKMKDCYRQEGWDKEVSSKEWIVSDKASFLWGMEGVYRAAHLTSADQAVLDWLV